ncbi:flagellin domain protein [halophilic archaeon DL31]|jgi:FlaG/FlaF family flagellin (archaellin)/methionine-rich copper-binding protein CopC|nr:flagellin domain protein [halophilic archaeon DL31]
MNERAQSESIGVILLVGVVVISVATVGAFVLSDISSDTVNADISVQITSNGFYFSHDGGDPLPMNELLIVVRSESGTSRPTFTPNTIYEGDDDAIFEPGERWANVNTKFDLETPVTISLFQTRTNSLLVKETAYPDRFLASGPTPPIPRISIDPDPAYGEDPVTFDSAGSEDPDGEIISYTWVFEDGTTVSGETATRTYPNPGTYTVTLSLEDDVGVVGNTSRTLTVLPANPQLETVEVSNAPLNDSDVDQTQTITVTFDREMDTSTTPTVELRNLTGNVTYGTGSWVDNRTFVQDIDIADADEESLGRVNVTGGADETGSVTEPDNSTTVFVDTSVPAISGFTVANPSGSTVTVEFTASERLEEVTVPLTEKNAGLITTFTVSEFTETEIAGGEYTYNVSYTVPTKGDYTATLDRATDTTDNDGATGQSDMVKVQSGSGKPVIRNFSGIVASADGDYVEVGNVTVEEFSSGNSQGIDSVTVEVREAGNSTVLGSTTIQGDKQTSRISREDVSINAPLDRGTTYNVTVIAISTNGESVTRSENVVAGDTLASGAPTIDLYDDVVVTKNAEEVTIGTLNASDETEITRVEFTVTHSSGDVVGNETFSINAENANLSSVSISTSKLGNKEKYTVEVRVYDSDGNVVSRSETKVAN